MDALLKCAYGLHLVELLQLRNGIIAAGELCVHILYCTTMCRREFGGFAQIFPELQAALIKRFGFRPILKLRRRSCILFSDLRIEARGV